MVKKKSGKKKGGGKRTRQKKDKKDEMTPGEAIIAYKISLKDHELEELKFQLKSEIEKKERNVERNARLVDERRLYMEKMLEKARSLNTTVNEKWTRDAVTKTMKENWQINKDEHQKLVDLHREIKTTEREIHRVNADILYWRSYKDNDYAKQQAQIRILEQSLVEMEESYQSIASYLERKFRRETGEIERFTSDAMDKQKDIAADKAVKVLDNNTKQEVIDHEWLVREEEIHRGEVDRLLQDVESLERENLKFLSELFECTVEDLKISKQVFLTQFHEDENLDMGNVVEIDLNAVFEDQLKQNARPKSAIQLSVEERYAQLLQRLAEDSDEADDDDEDVSVHDSNASSDGQNLFSDILTGEDWEDCLEIGPLELKMLCVTGTSAKMHPIISRTAEEEDAQKWNPDKWSVSKQGLATTLRSEHSELSKSSLPKKRSVR